MGNKSHFFRQSSGGGLPLVAGYNFNNNLIDDIGGNNGTGTDITFDNGSAVFSGFPSKVLINNLGAFDFTDGVNDLPFRIETSISLNSLPSGNSNPSTYILGKRDSTSTLQNYQFIVRKNGFEFNLISSNPTHYLAIPYLFPQNLVLNNNYNIKVTYDGSKTAEGLKMTVNNIEGGVSFTFGNYTGQDLTNSNVYLGAVGFSLNGDRLYFDGKINYLKIYK